jgi:fatty-acyl-CoA synthase
VNLVEVGEFWARWQPEAIAWTKGDESLTWRRLAAGTGRIAAALRDRGIAPGDRVGILAENSLNWCEFAIAILRAGAVVVPLNVRATSSELSYMIDKVDCRVVAVDSAMADRLSGVVSEARRLTVSLDDRAAADVSIAELRRGTSTPADTAADTPADTLAHTPPDPTIDADAPAVIAYTSGTTGYPKGATLTHRNILAMVETYTRWENWTAATTSLCFAPLAFTGGIVNALLGTYGVGGRLILEEFDPVVALERIVSVPVTAMTGVPIIYESIAALPEFADADLSALTTTITGGSVVTEKLLRAWADKGVQLRQAYGLTEAAGGSTLVPRARYADKSGTAGIPGVQTRIRIVDESDLPAGTDQVGEILVRGPQVMAGYWGEPAETARVLRDGWLHTGDLGSVDAEGYLTVVDRKHDMIISGGLNVYPAEIERVLAEVAGVTELAAVGVAHDRWGETVAVVFDGDAGLDKIYAFATEHLADYKVPRYLARADAPLPRGMSGKLLRRVIRTEFDPASAHRTPAT